MRAIFRFFVERHTVATLFTVLVILLGAGTLLQIKRDIFPEVDFGQVLVTTRYPGASPEDVELNVTNRIEDAVKEVSGVRRFTSFSMENLSFVTISLDLQARDKDAVRDAIREAVGRVTDLPAEVTESPAILEVKSQEIPVIEVGIGGSVDYRALRAAARQFKRKLETLPGVSRVEDAWNLDREIRIEVETSALEQYGVPLEQVSAAIRSRNVRAAGGSFESYTSRKGLVTLAQFRDPREVEDAIVISPAGGAAIRVADMARVLDTFEEPRIVTRMNGEPAITFQVIKDGSADVIRTVDAVRDLAERERRNLPASISIGFSNDLSYYVSNRFKVVLWNGAIGLVLVMLILAAFLTPRAAGWVALSIPVIFLGIIFLLPVAGTHLDLIGLAAMILVLGIIVDDGIIVSENIVRMRERGLPPVEAATEGILGVARPVFATLVTTFLAFAPMFYMTGVFGEFVYTIPLVITLAVLISFAEVVVALPAHLVGGLSRMKVGASKRGHWFDGPRRLYRRGLRQVLRLRYLFLGVSIVIFAGAILLAVRFMDFVLFPSSTASGFRIAIELPLGSSLEHTSDRTAEIEAIVAGLPEDQLDSFTTRIGTLGEQQPGEFENRAVIRVGLTPYSERGVTAEEILETIRPEIMALQGFEKVVFTVEAGGPPVGEPVNVKIVGPDDEQRRALADRVVDVLSSIDGVRDVDRNDVLGKSEVRLALDYDKLSALGLSVADVARTVRIAFDGEIATSVRYGDEDVLFRVILDAQDRGDTDTLRRLPVAGRDGRLVTLGTVARLDEGPGPSNIFHHDGLRATAVTSDVDKEKVTPLEVTRAVEQAFDLDRDWPGMRFVMGGESEETVESFRSLGAAFAIAVVAIYFVLVLLFGSWTQPLMVMVAIPFGVISVIIAFAMHGQTPGFLAAMGLVGLTGVVVNDSLVMVSHINDLRRSRPDDPVLSVVADGAANRLRAVVMTTLTTVVGLIPLAYGLGGSDPFIAPMALALGYGLLFATPLTLLMIPCLYIVRTDVGRLLGWMAGRLRGGRRG